VKRDSIIKVSVARGFRLMKAVGNVVSPNDPELVRLFGQHVKEQEGWNDLFSTKLIEVLDKIDELRSEARATLRKGESALMQAQEELQEVTRRSTAVSRMIGYALAIAACSWLITLCALWFAFRDVVPLWVAAVGGVAVIVVAIMGFRGLSRAT
jgi:hypothetical protein